MSQAYVMSEKCRMFMIDTLRFGYICHSKFISENTININKKKIKKENRERDDDSYAWRWNESYRVGNYHFWVIHTTE